MNVNVAKKAVCAGLRQGWVKFPETAQGVQLENRLREQWPELKKAKGALMNWDHERWTLKKCGFLI